VRSMGMERAMGRKKKSSSKRRARLMSTILVGSIKPVLGVDLGDSNSVATMLSPMNGSIVQEMFPFSMDEAGYTLFSSKVPKDARIACEATSQAYPFTRKLREMGYTDITVAHPKELAWIVKSKKKNDKADSLKIARLHMGGMLPESHLLEREEQVKRDLLIQRVKLGVEIGDVKRSIISYLKREDVYNSLPKTEDNFSVTRRLAIASLRFDDDRDLVLKTMMGKLAFLEAMCPPLEERIRQLAGETDDVKLLMSVQGINFYSASLYSSFVGDAKRFPDDDHLNSFLGIIPVSKDSGDKKRRGKMSKEGPSIARWTLGVMVDNVAKRNPEMKRYYQSVKERSGAGHAHVMTMKKLNRMLYHMLITRQRWKWEDADLTERKLSNLSSSTTATTTTNEGGVTGA
jgi:transposase